MTISPPSKAQTGKSPAADGAAQNVGLAPDEPGRVLAHGIDTLHLAINVSWKKQVFFAYLADLKAKAKQEREPQPGQVTPNDGSEPWRFTIESYGMEGYEWILRSRHLTMKIGNWAEPNSRPSLMVEIASEALWAEGPHAMLHAVRAILEGQHAIVREMNASRVDLCVDVLLREADWDTDLRAHLNTRATKTGDYEDRRKRTGLQVGRGDISARLYDKPQEIRQQSGKVWMYDVWKLEAVPEGHCIIRVEFQLRRAKLVEMGIGVAWDRQWLEGDHDQPSDVYPLLAGANNVWAYCTREWLKLVDAAVKRSNRQKLLPWWLIVQQGYGDAYHVNPVVLSKAVAANCRQLVTQTAGYISSLVALQAERQGLSKDDFATLDQQVEIYRQAAREEKLNDRELQEKVMRKRVDYQQRDAKATEAKRTRDRLHLGTYHEAPVNRPPDWLDETTPNKVSCSQTYPHGEEK